MGGVRLISVEGRLGGKVCDLGAPAEDHWTRFSAEAGVLVSFRLVSTWVGLYKSGAQRSKSGLCVVCVRSVCGH